MLTTIPVPLVGGKLHSRVRSPRDPKLGALMIRVAGSNGLAPPRLGALMIRRVHRGGRV